MSFVTVYIMFCSALFTKIPCDIIPDFLADISGGYIFQKVHNVMPDNSIEQIGEIFENSLNRESKALSRKEVRYL